MVFWVCDMPITTMYYISPAYEKIWGRTCESLIQSPRSFLDAIQPDDREKLLASLVEIELGRPQSSIYRITRPDGAVRWISERGFPVFNQFGAVYRCVGFAEDITERRAREEQLNKLMLAVEQSPAAVVITDAQGTIEFVNPKFTEVTGYIAAEALGNNPRILKSGKHDAEFYRDFWETITAGRDWRGEFCNKKKDGTLYWESASVSAIRNERNEITNFVAVKEDITAKSARPGANTSAKLGVVGRGKFDLHHRQTRADHVGECGVLPAERFLARGTRQPYAAYFEIRQAGRANSTDNFGKRFSRARSGAGRSSSAARTASFSPSTRRLLHLSMAAARSLISSPFTRISPSAKMPRPASSKWRITTRLPACAIESELHNRLEQAVQQAKRHSRSSALHFIDLDRFKVVNDTLGHSVGDVLLQAVAKRLGRLLAGKRHGGADRRR